MGAVLAEPVAAAASSLAARLAGITVEVRGHGRDAFTGAPAGAGVVWRADGLILTNAHVAKGAVSIVLPDRRVLPARLAARDVEQDLAALVVEATGLSAAEIGDSDALRVGELVLAVGAPGNSGGPLADARGRVVGLNAMIVGELAVAVPSRAGWRFVRERLGR